MISDELKEIIMLYRRIVNTDIQRQSYIHECTQHHIKGACELQETFRKSSDRDERKLNKLLGIS
ncbi:hypothetical protein LCGC14_1669730 [marine sediment metagenome]|uniref:Uncharacterized protein n=1 Tax=marine sediment metagenome TaxID=412755 RepID=A0A0F9HRN6_9ZZZZ